jgi:hypothetical protein
LLWLAAALSFAMLLVAGAVWLPGFMDVHKQCMTNPEGAAAFKGTSHCQLLPFNSLHFGI